MVPKPDSISESELHYIHTIFSRKNDGRKKTRSVLASGKDKLEAMPGANWGRTYSPTARPETMRLLCAMTAKKRGKIHGGDVTLAYGQAKWPMMIPDPSFGIIPDPGSRIPHPAYLPSDRSPRHTLLQ